MNTSPSFAIWLSWRELTARKLVFAINVLIIGILVSLPVSFDLMGKAKSRSIEQRIDYIGPSLSLVPEDATSYELVTARLGNKTMPRETASTLRRNFPDLVRAAEPRLLTRLPLKGGTMAVIGMDFAEVHSYPFTLYSPAPGEVLLGPVAAEKLGKAPGEGLSLGKRRFNVAAITETTGAIEDASLILPLNELQELTGLENRINEIRVYATSAGNLETLSAELKAGKYHALNVVDSYRGDVVEKDLGNTLGIYQQAVYVVAFLLMGLCIMISTYINLEGRRAEISTIYTLGSRQSALFAFLALRTTWIALVGTVAGHLLAFLVLFFSEPQAAFTALWSWLAFALVTGGTILLGLLVTLPFLVNSLFRRNLLADL